MFKKIYYLIHVKWWEVATDGFTRLFLKATTDKTFRFWHECSRTSLRKWKEYLDKMDNC